MKPSERFSSLIQYWAERAGLSADVVSRQVAQESSFNPRAVSSCGAMGLLQLMPATAKEMGCRDPFNPDDNLKAGTEYLARQLSNVRLALRDQLDPLQESDCLRLALAAYNGGWGYVRAAINQALASPANAPTWENVKQILPTISVRGRRPDVKQMVGYAEKIIP